MNKRLFIFSGALMLAGCAGITKVEKGSQDVGGRMTVTLDNAWNYMDFPRYAPAVVWTREGFAVDQLRFFAGVRSGSPIHPPQKPRGQDQLKSFTFRNSMQAEDLVALFEGTMTIDGSSFQVRKIDPATFLGQRGIRFEFITTRFGDNVVLQGLGTAAIINGELFAAVYVAPRLAFFPRYQREVDTIIASARLK
jgi:hypothetical protein